MKRDGSLNVPIWARSLGSIASPAQYIRCSATSLIRRLVGLRDFAWRGKRDRTLEAGKAQSRNIQ
jgi:hypothetical protein